MNTTDISINDYDYDLPESRIALHPPAERDGAKLLIYSNIEISETVFTKLHENLPPESLIVFNNTKVIHARIDFFKSSGSRIEIFCLEPAGKISEYTTVMDQRGSASWKCFVGGAAKWKEDFLEKKCTIGNKEISLKVFKKERTADAYIIDFAWEPEEFSFAEIIEAAGNVPLPPYIKRNTDAADESRYQTVFAEHKGSVAAPTASLHFSEHVLKNLREKNIHPAYVTLHVGAGTFKPVKSEFIGEHDMHAEYIDVSKEAIEQLRKNPGKIIAAGTTSLRTIESIYWLGVKVFLQPEIKDLSLGQWEVYQELSSASVSAADALQSLLDWLQKNNRDHLFTKTQILIAPGYRFRIANWLITNFHQPKSTLLLLVAAATNNHWKEIYQYAMENEFRFLSYGDASLLRIAE